MAATYTHNFKELTELLLHTYNKLNVEDRPKLLWDIAKIYGQYNKQRPSEMFPSSKGETLITMRRIIGMKTPKMFRDVD